MSRIGVLATSLALVAWTACAPADSGQRVEGERVQVAATSEELVLARSTVLLAAIRDRDLEIIAGFIHPTRGVRFSPYAFVELGEDQVLTAAEFVDAWNDDSPRLWGVEDGTGDPLTMSCAEYWQRFVYDVDFMQAEQIAVGDMIGRGNTTNNALEVYPAATIVEYHFSGFDPKYEGLDWKSLRLVLEPIEGGWLLVGVIHDQWTV